MSTEQLVMITARDKKSGEELHCEAKIAKIERV